MGGGVLPPLLDCSYWLFVTQDCVTGVDHFKVCHVA